MIDARGVADLWLRAGADQAIALRSDDRTVSYAELRGLVDQRSAELDLADRSVVVLTGDRSIEFVVTYLALLDARHVPLLTGDHAAELAERWDVGALIRATGDGWAIDRRATDGVEVHPDLALLLSTSGSTGSPKLVRLSHENLRSNAASIADYLHLSAADHAISSLPLHYCYGLSILHSHLSVGAGITLTEASVVDPCFHAAMADHGVTNLAGVPHTFELLERVGPEAIAVPSLRLITQAGGRLGPDRVTQWLDRADAWDADFVVMYGQTEATARMAYLPPSIARRRPEVIGRAIPDGHLSIQPVDEATDLGDDVGELVYEGPNVMLGYAETSDHLALGRTVELLRTGDLARYHADDDVFEIVGRRARFIKPFGVRVDLGEIERIAAELDDVDEIAATGDDTRLVVAAPGADAERLRQHLVEHSGLPVGAVSVDVPDELPRTAAGKIDYPAIVQRADSAVPATDGAVGAAAGSPVAAVFGRVLDRRDVDATDTFVGLGGDSLSYVECSMQLERTLDRVPEGWHLMSIAQLDALAVGAKRRRWFGRVDTTVLLRALAICAVVSTHMRFWRFPGGAHILLTVVGYNLARFLMPIQGTREVVRAGFRTIGRVAIPTVLWVAGGLLFTGAAFGIGTLLLVNNYVGPAGHQGDEWHFWFIEVFVQLALITMALFAIPAVRRAYRRWPFALPLVVLGITLFLKLDWFWADSDWFNFRYRTHSIAWFFAIGWLIHQSDTIVRKLVSTGLLVAFLPGAFDQPEREWFIGITIVAMIWIRELPLPRLLLRPVATLASASMWILISHFTFWPPLKRELPIELAYVITLAIGVAFWAAAEWLTPRAIRLARSAFERRPRFERPWSRPGGAIPA